MMVLKTINSIQAQIKHKAFIQIRTISRLIGNVYVVNMYDSRTSQMDRRYVRDAQRRPPVIRAS